MGWRQLAIGSLSVVLVAAMLSPASGQTAAERCQRLREERQQELAQRRAEREAQQRQAAQREAAQRRGETGRPDTAPKSFERPEDGFALRTPAGWIEHGEASGQVRLQLAYINLPPGQRDAGSFRVLVAEPPPSQSLEDIARAWQQRIPFEGEARHQPLGRAEIDGLEAVVVQASGQTESMERTERGVFVQRGRKTYIFYTSSPANVQDRVLASARQIERSIKWLGEPEPGPAESGIAEAAPTPNEAADDDAAGKAVTGKAVAGKAVAGKAATGKATYAGDGITVEYPRDWRRQESAPLPQMKLLLHPGKTAEEIEPGDFAEHVALIVITPPAQERHLTSAQLGEQMIELARRDHAGFELLTSEPFTVGDQEGYLFTERYHNALGMHLQRTLIIAAHGGRHCFFQLVGNVGEVEPYVPVVKEMASTARFEKAEAAAEAAQRGPDAPVRTPPQARVAEEELAKVEAASQDLTEYKHDAGGITLRYPSVWKTIEEKPAVDVGTVLLHLAPDPLGIEGQVRVIVAMKDRKDVAERLHDEAESVASALAGGGRRTTHGSAPFGGNKRGAVVAYQADDSTRSTVCVAEHGDKVFILAFAAPAASFSAWRPVVYAMQRKVEWDPALEGQPIARRPATPASQTPSQPATPPQPAEPVKVVVPPALAAEVEAASKELATFDNNQIGVRFKHPAAWKEVEADAGAMNVYLQLGAPAVGGVQPLVTFGTFDKGPLSSSPRALVRLMGRMISESTQERDGVEGPIGNKAGYQAVYAGRQQHCLVAVVEHRNQMYMIAFAASPVAFEAWRPAVKAMLDSVEWID